MKDGKKILAIIPARGGSKGIPHKNIINLCGKPLIAYSIEAAKKSKFIDEVVVSTDDEAIKACALTYGASVPFLRPESLSGDVVGSAEVVLHCIEKLEEEQKFFDSIILLQPTSPLRTTKDIDEAIELFFRKEAGSLVGVCVVKENPILMRTIEDGKLQKVLEYRGNLRRQDLPAYYIFNGAIYINKISNFKNNSVFINEDTIPYIMEEEKSIDIDSPVDLIIAEYYLNAGSEKNV